MAGRAGLIAAGNGAWLLTVSVTAGAIVLAVAIVAGLLARSLWRRRRALKRSPVAEAPWLIFDVDARVLRDHAGAVLAPLDQVRVEPSFQRGSSSQALRVRWPGGAQVIARGTPFGDGIDAVAQALASRGIG